MASKKEHSVERATKLLEPLSKKPPDYTENHAIYDVMARIPAGVSMDLVTKVLRQQVARGSIDSSATMRMRVEYLPAVAAVLRDHPKDKISLFMLAALPEQVEAWAPLWEDVHSAQQTLAYLGLDRYDKGRPRVLASLVKNPRAVAGAQAQAAVLNPDTSDGALLLLAAEGSAESMDVMMKPVSTLLKNSNELDWLTKTLAPLLTAPATRALKELIESKTQKRNATSQGLQAGEALGLRGKDWFRFKVALFGEGGWPKMRMWIDSTKDPWFGAIWNFNEMVHFPRAKEPRKQLEALFTSAKSEATWVRYQFSSPHTGEFKKTLAAWVASQLKGVTLD